jgi:hypothetical protein
MCFDYLLQTASKKEYIHMIVVRYPIAEKRLLHESLGPTPGMILVTFYLKTIMISQIPH